MAVRPSPQHPPCAARVIRIANTNAILVFRTLNLIVYDIGFVPAIYRDFDLKRRWSVIRSPVLEKPELTTSVSAYSRYFRNTCTPSELSEVGVTRRDPNEQNRPIRVAARDNRRSGGGALLDG